jgi:acetyl-CoA acetyltransferase
MADVFIYDHVRTPRGRGKKDGSLHEVPIVRLASHRCSKRCATATVSTPRRSTT